MDEELVGQVELGGGVLGHHQQPAGILVYPVHQHAHALVLHVRAQVQVIGQGVHQRTVVVAVTGVHHHAGGFVHHQHVVVFIDNVQGNVFRKDFRAAALVGHHELDHVQGPDNVVGLHRLLVHQHIAQFDGLLHTAAGSIFLMLRDETVYPHRLLSLVHIEPEVLEHQVFFRGHFCGTFSGSSVREIFTPLPRERTVPAASCLYTTAFMESA